MDENIWAEPNNFSLVLRSTTVEYARQFLEKGQIKFSTPQSWVEYAEINREGRGDFYEGTIAFTHFTDIKNLNDLIKKYENHDALTKILYRERFLVKRNKNMLLPCFCFYTLKNSMFDIPKEEGEQKLTTTIPPEYFRDFCDQKPPEEIELLEEDLKPSVITIFNFELFKERLIKYLISIGVEKEDIIIGRVSYFDFEKYGKEGYIDFGQRTPLELLVKEKRFKNQNEGRIIVNTKNKGILNTLNKPIELGNMEDVSVVSDRYLFEGVNVQLTSNIKKI